MRRRKLTAGGHALKKWLDDNEHSQPWLVDELNRRRMACGVPEKIGRSNLWRWMTGSTLINVDDAMLILLITGIEISTWSRYSVLVAREVKRRAA